MTQRVYYVVNDGEADWGVRLNDGAVEGHTDRDVALSRAQDAAAADRAKGHDARVLVLTELGFELHGRYGQHIHW